MRPDQSRPAVLLITRNLPPLIGGMERLMQNAAGGIARYADLTVIGPKGCSRHLPPEVTVLEASAKLAPFLLMSTWLALKAIRKEHFTIVIGGSGLVAPTLYIIARLHSCTTIIYLHGLDLVVDNFLYKKIFIPCIRKANKVIVNSRNTARIAIEGAVKESRITVINPGTSLPCQPDDKAVADFRARYNIEFDKVIIFVGRITKRKGLSGFIRHSLPAILAAEPTTGLVIVGENPGQSLNRMGEQKEVLAEVERLDEKKNSVVFLGHIDDNDLNTCYAAADLQVLPLIEVPGDVEGFGMIAVEAAACGTPTVAFDLGGVGDAISKDNGCLVTADRYDLFSEAVLHCLSTGEPDSPRCLQHAQQFSWEIFHSKLHKLLLAPLGD